MSHIIAPVPPQFRQTDLSFKESSFWIDATPLVVPIQHSERFINTRDVHKHAIDLRLEGVTSDLFTWHDEDLMSYCSFVSSSKLHLT